MRKILTIAVGLFLAACATKQPVYVDEHIFLQGVDASIVKSIRYNRNDNNLIQVELILQNKSDKKLDYKINWLDGDGFTLSDPINLDYNRIYLNGGRELQLKKVAPDARAKNFKIILKSI